jgi:hypothetical protein
MDRIEEIMAEDDVMVLVHGYLAGGFAGVDGCITGPDDVNGLQTRAAGKRVRADAGRCRCVDRLDGVLGDLQRHADRRSGRGQHLLVVLRQSYRIYEQVSLLHAGRRHRAVVHVSAAADEQIHLRRPDRRTAGRAAGRRGQGRGVLPGEAKKEDAASAEAFAEPVSRSPI